MRASVAATVLVLAMSMQAGGLQAREQGDWIFRAGVGYVDPKSDNGDLDGTDIGISVDGSSMFIFDVTYMVTHNWGVELLASAPFEHDINLDGLGEVGSTKHLPPTLSGQYHFNPMGRFQPYVGVGINWTLFMDEDTSGALAGTDLELDDSFGFALQAGVDIDLTDKLYLNAVVRYLDIATDAEVDGTKVAKVEIEPMVYGLNIGYRF